jgi:hypothetical protein
MAALSPPWRTWGHTAAMSYLLHCATGPLAHSSIVPGAWITAAWCVRPPLRWQGNFILLLSTRARGGGQVKKGQNRGSAPLGQKGVSQVV